MTGRVGGPLLIALALGASVTVTAADAGIVDVVGGSEAVRYVAAPGEANDLRFQTVEDSWPSAYVVVDSGATVTPATGCIGIEAHSAACISASGAMYHLRADLGDGDDVLRPAGFDLVRADGGPGDDRLFGGTWDDNLNGGGGTDELRGGVGADVLSDGDRDDGGAAARPDADVLDGGDGRDSVSYARRTAAVTVDLSTPAPAGEPGEQDVLTGIESVRGGRGDDRLTGDDGPNRLDGAGGSDRIAARGGDDIITGARAGTVACGDGDDGVRGVTRQTWVAPSCEALLRAYEDDDLVVPPYPRATPRGLAMTLVCPTFDGEPIDCAGRVGVYAAGGAVLAHGRIAPAPGRRTVRLTLTQRGRRVLARRAVVVTIDVRGRGMPDMAWRVTLERRR